MTTMTTLTPPTFVILQNPIVRWPVVVRIPSDGGMAEWRFDADIRVFSEERHEALMPPVPDDKDAKRARPAMKEVLADNAHWLPMHVANWYGVVGGDGQPLPVEALPEQILYGPYGVPLSRGLWRAIHEVRYGLDPLQGGATAGNSAASPGAGPS